MVVGDHSLLLLKLLSSSRAIVNVFDVCLCDSCHVFCCLPWQISAVSLSVVLLAKPNI